MNEKEKRSKLREFKNSFRKEMVRRFSISDFDAGYITMFGLSAADDGAPWPDGLREFVTAKMKEWDSLAAELDNESKKEEAKEAPEELNKEATMLRQNLPSWRRQVRTDPEGCFGGRGNNFGYAFISDAEERLAWLESEGY